MICPCLQKRHSLPFFFLSFSTQAVWGHQIPAVIGALGGLYPQKLTAPVGLVFAAEHKPNHNYVDDLMSGGGGDNKENKTE